MTSPPRRIGGPAGFVPRAFAFTGETLSNFETSTDWIRRILFVSSLAALLVLFERLAPVIALLSAAWIVFARRQGATEEPVERVAPRVPATERMVEELPVEEDLAEVIPLNNSFAPAWQDLDDFLRASLDVIKTRFSFQTANIFLRGVDRQTLVQRAFVSESGSVARLATLKFGHGLVGWVASNRRSLVVANMKQEARALGYYRSGADRVGSFAAAPIFVGDQVVGVISIDHSDPGAFSSPETEQALEAMAGLVGRVLGAEETMESERRETDRLREARRILRAAYEAADLDGAVEAAVRELVTVGEFSAIACYLLDEGGSLSRRAAVGFNGIMANEVKEPVMQRAAQQAISQVSPFRIEGPALAAQYRGGRTMPSGSLPQSLVAWPILHRGEDLGALVVEVTDKRRLDRRVEGIITDVVRDLGGAFLRVYRTSSAEGNARKESELVKFASGLLESGSTEEVWEKVFNHLLTVTSAESAASFRLDDKGFTAESVAGCSPSQPTFPRDGGMLGWTVLAGRPVAAGRNDKRGVPIEEGERFLFLPVGSGESPRGVVVLVSGRKEAFDSEEMEKAATILAAVHPVLVAVDRIEDAAEKLDRDAVTGLHNEAAFRRRLGALAVNSPVSTVVFAASNYDEMVAEFGRREVNHVLRRTASVLETVAGRRGIVGRIEAGRFVAAVRGEGAELLQELRSLLTGSSLISIHARSLEFAFATASTNEGIRWEEQIEAAEARLGRKAGSVEQVSGAA